MLANSNEKKKISEKFHRKKLGRNIFFLVIISLTAVLGYLGYRTYRNTSRLPEGTAQINGKEISGPAEEEIFYAVKTVKAEMGSITDYIDVNGDAVSRKSVKVFAETQGILKQLSIKIGDFVREGQVMAQIDPSKPGGKFAMSPVLAKTSGTVTSLEFAVGDVVDTQKALAVIDDLRQLQIISFIPEKFIPRVYKGMKAKVKFLSIPERVFNFQINRLSPVVDPLNRSLEVRINVPQTAESERIKAGMYAEVSLEAEVRNNAVKLPADCLIRSENIHVYVVEDNIAKKRNVKTGIIQDGMAEIIEGVEPEDKVVCQGQSRLEDGVKVRDISSESESKSQ